MQLTKHALSLIKIFFSKLFSIVIVYSVVYTYKKYIGGIEDIERISAFMTIFIAAYFLSISAVWTVVYHITCVIGRFNESWRKTTVLWIVMYTGFWVFALYGNMYRYEAWNVTKLSLEVASGTVKTLPSLLIFILISVEMPHSLFTFSEVSDKSEVLDAELAKSSRDGE